MNWSGFDILKRTIMKPKNLKKLKRDLNFQEKNIWIFGFEGTVNNRKKNKKIDLILFS